MGDPGDVMVAVRGALPEAAAVCAALLQRGLQSVFTPMSSQARAALATDVEAELDPESEQRHSGNVLTLFRRWWFGARD